MMLQANPGSFALLVFWLAEVSRVALCQSIEDWPTYNHDVKGSRYNSAEHAIGPHNAAQLVEKWRFPADGSEQNIGVIHATPIVVEGEVYFGTATLPAFYKLSPKGRLLWIYPAQESVRNVRESNAKRDSNSAPAPQPIKQQLELPGPVFGSALVTKDSVVFTDFGGWIYSLDRKSGTEQWKVNMRGKDFPGAHEMNLSFASPIVADGKLIIAGGTLEQLFAAMPGYRGCTGRGFVAALAPETGKILWKYDVGPKPEPLDPPLTIKDRNGEHVFHFGPASSSVWSTPSFDAASETIFFGTDVNTAPRRPTAENPDLHTRESCGVIALDVESGAEKWVTQINPGDVWTNAMPAYNPDEGRYKDQSIGDTPKIYSIAVAGQMTKVVGVGCKNGGFYVLRADNGRIVDHTPIYSGPPSTTLSPQPDPRMIALPGPVGGIQTGCATDGVTVFTNGIDALWLCMPQTPPPPGGPVTAGRVVAISSDARSERWRHDRPQVASLGGPPPQPIYRNAGDPVASGLAVANGVVYFTTVASGKLVALDAATGRLLKEFELGPVWSGPSVSRGRVYVGSGNSLLTPSDQEAFFPKKFTGTLYSFGLPGEDAVDRLQNGSD